MANYFAAFEGLRLAASVPQTVSSSSVAPRPFWTSVLPLKAIPTSWHNAISSLTKARWSGKTSYWCSPRTLNSLVHRARQPLYMAGAQTDLLRGKGRTEHPSSNSTNKPERQVILSANGSLIIERPFAHHLPYVLTKDCTRLPACRHSSNASIDRQPNGGDPQVKLN
jgi:hypothetical protein